MAGSSQRQTGRGTGTGGTADTDVAASLFRVGEEDGHAEDGDGAADEDDDTDDDADSDEAPKSADSTRYSRSILCAVLDRSVPGGFFRSTYRLRGPLPPPPSDVSWYVGFDCP